MPTCPVPRGAPSSLPVCCQRGPPFIMGRHKNRLGNLPYAPENFITELKLHLFKDLFLFFIFWQMLASTLHLLSAGSFVRIGPALHSLLQPYSYEQFHRKVKCFEKRSGLVTLPAWPVLCKYTLIIFHNFSLNILNFFLCLCCTCATTTYSSGKSVVFV